MGALMNGCGSIAALLLLWSPATAQDVLDVLDTHYLVPADINPFQEFGTALDADGDTLIVGSPTDEDHGLHTGSAYVFVRSGGAWALQQKLLATAPFASERFGSAVAVSGDVAIVGQPMWGIPGAPAARIGRAQVFRRSGSTWTFEAELHASDEAWFWHFGESVAVQGDTIVVGAPQRGTSSTSQYDDHGAAYVFQHAGGAWTQTTILRASEGTDDDRFGERLALSGDTVVIGASGHNGGGVAYAFVRDGAGTWSEQAILVPPNLGAGGAWVESLAFEGDVAVMGNWRHGIFPAVHVGRVLVWRRTAGAWAVEGVLSPGDAPAQTSFGRSVSVNGERIAVGAPGRNTSGISNELGSAWIFVRHAGTWTPEARVRAQNSTAEDEFGNALTWSGSVLVTGAWFRWEWGIRSGAVYDCDLDQRARTYCQSLPNSAGAGAWIGATGSLSITANDCWLICGGLPPGSSGKFFYGTAQASAPFGNGLRCVGGAAFRLYPLLVSGASGSVVRHLDFTQHPAGIGAGTISAGSTWHFQYWHRNAAAGGAGFNLSDGWRATFVP